MRDWINLSDSKRIYRMGLCDAMAIALHDHTGYPIAVWRGYFPDDFGDDGDGDEAYEDVHMCVIAPDGRWIDVDGYHTATPENLMFNQPVERVELVRIGREEAKSIFTVEGVTESEIKIAAEYLPPL